MTGRLLKFGILAAVLALVVTAFAAQSREKMDELAKLKTQTAPRTFTHIEDIHNLPVADAKSGVTEIRSSSRSASILDDSRSRRSLRASAQASPGTALCAAGTSYDYQHNDLGQKMVATLGGNPATANVHFAWMHWDVIPESIDRVDRFTNYNGFNPSSGLCLGDCGVTVSGAGGDPLLARGGYVTIDVTSDDNAFLAFHQRSEAQQPPTSDQRYSSYTLDQGLPCFNLFADNELPGSNPGEAIWPHGAIDRGGGVKAPGDDVYHVTSRPTGDWPPFATEIHYWRRVGLAGAWEGPVVLDNSGQLNHHIATDPTSQKVAVVYTQDITPANPDELLQVVYMQSATNGADWIAAGFYPDPLTAHGFPFTQVTSYSDPLGHQSWIEAGGEFDLDGELHVFWVEQDVANTSSDCRLKHWSASTGFSTISQAITWPDLNGGGDGGRDLVLAFPGIAFGDGSTNCSDGPANPGSGGANSNRNYVYYLSEQYGGETAVEQADHSATTGLGGAQQNLEFYLSASNDGGATWSPPANLTNTKTPGCDGTPGNECASERDPNMALVVNNAIHIQYILDVQAGDAVFAQGSWRFNPVMYYKIPGGNDAALICPEIAPSFAARLTNQEPGCEYHASHTPAGQQIEDLIVENFGNAPMHGNISEVPNVDWLTILPAGNYTIGPGTGQTSTVTMNAGAASIQTGGEGLYQSLIRITHDDPSRVSPRDIPVDFFVFNQFFCPQHVTLKTAVNSPGVLYLSVSNVENFGNQSGLGAGLARMNPNPAIGDSSYSVYDGSLLIALPPSPDTLVFRQTFGEGNGQPGFRALGDLEVDTSAYGTNAGYASAFANQTTVDSTIGVDVTYIFPQRSDSAEFVLIKYKIFNRTASTIPGMIVGNAVDFDVTPGPDSVQNLQTGSQNTAHLRSDYNLVYQQGVDSVNHAIVGDVTATRFKGGITSIQCGPAPRAWSAPNDPWLFSRPGGGWSEGYLYQEMTKNGFEIFPPNDPNPEEDIHTGMVHEQGISLTPTTVKHYLVGLVSSRTGTGETDLINTTKKAWKYAFGWDEFVDFDTVHENTPASYPYFAIGSHEGGLAGGCCGCVVTEVSDPQNKFSIGGGSPGDCEGTIEFAGGDKCNQPFIATYKVQDLCAQYTDLYVIKINTIEACGCLCPYQGDYDTDNFLTALDLGALIDVLFAGRPEDQDPACPNSRGDLDCDGFPTALDLGIMIDYLFAGGPAPCNPCAK